MKEYFGYTRTHTQRKLH